MLCEISNKKSNSDLIFVFFNGFGSDYKYWENLLPYFSEYNYILLSENYFEYPDDYDIQCIKQTIKGKKIVGVGHSLGYYKLCDLNQKYDFFNLEKIISVEGFSRYLGTLEPIRSIRRYFLDLMKVSYTYFPKVTLSNFMAMCGAPIMALPSKLNTELLMRDLNLLYTGINPPKIPHLVLSSLDDWVIPTNIVEDNFRNLPNTTINYTSGSGHLLGMKQAKYVSEKIQQFAVL